MTKLIIDIQNVSIELGSRFSLTIDSLKIYQGEKVGIVGLNGSGKSTLLNLIAGTIQPDTGSIKSYGSCSYFSQFGELEENYSYEEVCRLGIHKECNPLFASKGEKMKYRLASILSKPCDVLLLDEPTNSLDSQGIHHIKEKLWLYDTIILVSHERSLLNDYCTRIIEIDDGTTKSYAGNYNDYLQQKELERKTNISAYEKYNNEVKRLKGIYNEKKEHARAIERKKNNGKISTSDFKTRNFCAGRKIEDKARSMEKSATNVLKRIEHLEKIDKPKEQVIIRPDFKLTNPPINKVLIRCENYSFSYDERMLFHNISFELKKDEKIALVGDNGVGKTTLINRIIDDENIYKVPKLNIGVLKQNAEDLDNNKTVLEIVRSVSIQNKEVNRNTLKRLLFKEEMLKQNVGLLSGGEKMKLAFCCLVLSKSNMLILDEPTTFLDIESIEAIEDVLREYEGSAIIITHDIELIRKVATNVLHIKNGNVTRKEVEDYLQEINYL